MARHPLRRSQLVAPFGVGSMNVFPDGVALMIAGLDHWYASPQPGIVVDAEEFAVEEWRLAGRLGVDSFRLPPDHRPRWRATSDQRSSQQNLDMKIPALRFPTAHVCNRCQRLSMRPLTESGRVHCVDCKKVKSFGIMEQVQFVALCEDGHIQDFPWREWVHHAVTPSCDGQLKVYSTGAGSLAGVYVECACGEKRNLNRITNWASPSGPTEPGRAEPSTFLTESLEKGRRRYTCAGDRPWLAEVGGPVGACGRPLRGALRSAANTYFGATVSSIYVPRKTGSAVPSDLLETLEAPPANSYIQQAIVFSGNPPSVQQLRERFSGLVDEHPDEVVAAALDVVVGRGGDAQTEVDEGQPEALYRATEYVALSHDQREPSLVVRNADLSGYEPWCGLHLDRVVEVQKLRVTKAFTGFSRLVAQTEPVAVNYEQLFRDPPPRGRRWLPASIVFGEGLFLELSAEKLAAWESRADVEARAATVRASLAKTPRSRASGSAVTARLMLLHSLAHVMILQLAFDSGYSAASLGERLYADPNADGDLRGVLIYTAAGDSDGTMGGLVRLAKEGRFEGVVRRALERSLWCSTDPVCMEAGDVGGQGPDNCNLAACYGCAILPETACEEFNRFLDRALLIGTPENPALGFFSDVVGVPA